MTGFSGTAKLCVGDSEQLRQSLRRLRREVTVRPEVSFNDIGRCLLGVIDNGPRLLLSDRWPSDHAFEGDIEPFRKARDVVRVRLPRAVLNAGQGRRGNTRLFSHPPQT